MYRDLKGIVDNILNKHDEVIIVTNSCIVLNAAECLRLMLKKELYISYHGSKFLSYSSDIMVNGIYDEYSHCLHRMGEIMSNFDGVIL